MISVQLLSIKTLTKTEVYSKKWRIDQSEGTLHFCYVINKAYTIKPLYKGKMIPNLNLSETFFSCIQLVIVDTTAAPVLYIVNQ